MVRRIIWDMSLRSEGHTHDELELRDLWLECGLTHDCYLYNRDSENPTRVYYGKDRKA